MTNNVEPMDEITCLECGAPITLERDKHGNYQTIDREATVERYSDEAIRIIDSLHTERLDYHSEYIPLIDAAQRLAAYENTCLSRRIF